MRGLVERDLFPLWEQGEAADSEGRSGALLAVAVPGLGPDAAAALTVGERDAALLELHVRTFGSRLEGFVHCPECAEPLEVELGEAEVRAILAAAPAAGEQELSTRGYRLRFRALTCGDLVAAATAGDLGAVRAELVRRCVLDARRGRARVTAGELPERVVDSLAERLAESDPQSEIALELTCPECGCGWRALVDVGSFLWAEVSAATRRLLEDVHVLARGYGWTEAEVLGLSRRRRALYVELALG
jgi:hypothetical protein